ncbi:MAG: hypothetical protein ACTHU0_38285, partial [Kofleriaceae bacterium]
APITGRPLAGLVDEVVDAARPHCAAPLEVVTGGGRARQLARARWLDDRPSDALAALRADDPAIRLRRAELLDREGRFEAARLELDAAIARAPDHEALAARRRISISIAVRAGRAEEVAREIAGAPLVDQPALAYRAAADAPAAGLDALAAAARGAPELAAARGVPELAAAVADRIERERGPAAALVARQLAADGAPARAEHHDALARSLAIAGRVEDALAAWDRAAQLAPAQPAFRLAPIRALVVLGRSELARGRARVVIEAARAGGAPEELLTAAAAAAAIRDTALAVQLAREARARRPGDGRLAFAVAERLVEHGDRAAAAAALGELLACGAHGRPWHRHEVAGRLLALAADPATARIVEAALAPPPGCQVVDPADLARYVEPARAQLRALLAAP